MPLFDTHAHLDDPQLLNKLDEYVNEASEQDVDFITAIGTTVPSSQQALAIANRYPSVFAAVGIHPQRK
jgi:TatD DNase family protein